VQTQISPAIADDPRVIEAEKTLRKCVHCGFCLATCPTYNLLGDELDSPRGRIYLIKQVVEGKQPSKTTLKHLDRCLTCRNCETTCPSGVEYGHLLDNGRSLVEEQVGRPFTQRLMRKAVLLFLPYSSRITPLVKLGFIARKILPAKLKQGIPAKQEVGTWPETSHARTMLMLDGCVQPAMAPATNAAMARVLDALGISVQIAEEEGCCGAVHFHLNEQDTAKQFVRNNIDAWWPHIEKGAENIIVTASGCGVMVKDYGHIMKDDPDYSEKAAKVSALCKDPVEVLRGEDLSRFTEKAQAIGPVAFHPPCTLQHGQKLPQVTESLLTTLGFTLTPIADSHICCGSAGTYSLFQPKISKALREKKVASIVAGEIAGNPSMVVTANIGCQLHLQSGLGKPVKHWVELLDQLLDA